jgi:hypothetical protein
MSQAQRKMLGQEPLRFEQWLLSSDDAKTGALSALKQSASFSGGSGAGLFEADDNEVRCSALMRWPTRRARCNADRQSRSGHRSSHTTSPPPLSPRPSILLRPCCHNFAAPSLPCLRPTTTPRGPPKSSQTWHPHVQLRCLNPKPERKTSHPRSETRSHHPGAEACFSAPRTLGPAACPHPIP